MGYLNKETITVDAILTNRGRELLAKGQGATGFQITKFAVADDEVDYRLYNTAHPRGSQFYGAIIENMPVLEASPDETQIMRYKLVTLSGAQTGIQVIPAITGITFTSTTLYFSPTGGQSKTIEITPTTSTGAETDGYTLQLADSTLATVQVLQAITGGTTGVVPADARGSITAKGTKFKIEAQNKRGTTSVTVYGNNSGAIYTFSISTVPSA